MQNLSKLVNRIMIIGAHPDDAEIMAGGLLYQLHLNKNVDVLILSITNGNKGHHIYPPSKIAEIRRKEANSSAIYLNAQYKCLNINDGELYITPTNTETLTRVIRNFNPDILITHRSCDYHRDHRYTSQLVEDVSYMLKVPQFCPDVPINTHKMPIILNGYDKFTYPRPIRPDVIVSLDECYEDKINLLMHHQSQMAEWLPFTQGKIAITKKEEIREFTSSFLDGCYQNAQKILNSVLKTNETSKSIHYAEIFEICEYGRVPTELELKNIFPNCIVNFA